MPVSINGSNESYQGIWPAIWMLPNDPISEWPLRGEIDIAELHGLNPNQALATLHFGNTISVSDYQLIQQNPVYYDSNKSYGYYHRFGLEWNFDENNPYIATWYDGKEVAHHQLNVAVPGKNYAIYKDVFKPGQELGYYLILNIATGGNFGSTTSRTSNGSGDSSNPLLQMKISSITAYQL